MIDIDEAYEVLFRHVKPGETVEVPLDKALHHTLAVPVRCDVDCPPFERSVMDGYAVRAADVADAPVALRVVGQIAAGVMPSGAIHAGEAVQINTGAPIPPGADAVVRVEHTRPTGGDNTVLIEEAVPSGHFITPRAEYVSAGQTVLEAGTRLTPLGIGAAAAAGATTVTVYRRPTVAVLATGDEIIDIGQTPADAQIRNSNGYLLAALVTAAHAKPVVLGIAPDNKTVLRERIVEGLREDVLCITGGVSMGSFDFVPDVLEACGAKFHIRKLAVKPGRPTVFAATQDGTTVFALPGNPAGAYVAFELLVKPALAALQGRGAAVPPQVRAALRGSIKRTGNRRAYLPARSYVCEDGGWIVEPLSWHGSGDLFGMAAANALIMRPPQAGAAKNGDTVSILLLDSP